ncbi:MAG: TIGR03546 family protein, partial [Spirochaetales bacterium]|nr:TIGR03546 family protein [Spirochaetales bacterium]
MLKPIVKLLVALNSNSRPGEIGFGIAAGVILALVPGGNLTWFALMLLFCLFKLNLPSMALTAAIGKLIVPAADPLLHRIGSAILLQPALEGFFTRLYNMPLVPFTNFNSTTLMGALAAG